MDIIYSRELSASVVAELAMLGSRHVLARTTYHSPADVYIVPRWYGSTRRCDEPSASDRWERVQINADAYPALTAWLADDDRSLARQNQEDDRTEGSREIEDAAFFHVDRLPKTFRSSSTLSFWLIQDFCKRHGRDWPDGA